MRLKVGVPVFGYQHFTSFQMQVERSGYFSANLGDNVQSIAIRRLLERLGVPPGDIVSVNRDTLAEYSGAPVALIMNGAFSRWSFPLPPQVHPIFIGLCVDEQTIVEFRDAFARYQPIGCRDRYTETLFQRYGVDAYVTGCLTLTLPERPAAPAADRVLLVYGSGAGAFPSSVLRHMPAHLLDRAEFIYQRMPVTEFPLDQAQCLKVENYARALLQEYAERAHLVVTPLHHAAAPCMAMGIPVVICRTRADPRFSYLAEVTQVHLPESFHAINWEPPALDVRAIRRRLEDLVTAALASR